MKSNKYTPPKLFSEEQLIEFFEAYDFMFINKQKVMLSWEDSEPIMATYAIGGKTRKYHLDLLAEYTDAKTFINTNQIASVKDIDIISKSELWLRYLNGDGHVCCNIYDLEVEICFKVAKNMTTVYSLGLNFYDEVYHVLSLPQQFEEYFKTHWERWFLHNDIHRIIKLPVVSL